jgi:outer membrane protein assembly factor BamB
MKRITAYLVLLVSPWSVHGDWPLFRGNALQTGVADSKLPERLEVLWQAKLGDAVEGAPAITDGMVYIGSYDEHLYALDLMTGKEKWKFKCGPTKASPSVYKGNVFIGNEDGYFHCVDAASGNKKWTYETNGEITCGANFAGDRVIFGSHDSTLYCLTLDGKLDWKFQTEGPVNGSPVIVGERTFLAGCDSNLHVIDIKAGKSLAAVDLQGQAGATAAVVGNNLYVGTMTNQVQAVDLKKNELAWT